MITSIPRAAAIAALLFLAGCAAKRPIYETRPAPSAPSATTAPLLLPPPSPEPPALPSSPAPPAKPSENTAVVALLQKSQSQSSAGQWDAASASLERALRIEPRNPALWQRLARVRLDQGDYAQAENLAAKSNSLAGSDQRLRAENWRIIGQARSKRGDQAGARAAFERAERER
ncbi:tetratricopeptide repeat protein [Trichloromonas sp.]|uniref:tetratricopeptide repeat protein n=1 Tax=Trichloromonas sp. TaxID=3069249 RepID=UPI003D81B1FF